MAGKSRTRRLPIGAEVLAEGGVAFRVWADRHRRVDVVVEDGGGSRRSFPLDREAAGYFAGRVPGAGPGTLYRYRVDQGDTLLPDPASRFQPEGPHGPSQVIDPASFRWTDEGWAGPAPDGQVLYEMHVGTFTAEGSWSAAAAELAELAAAGITAVEVMPVADFAGRFGWGYDGVNLFAPTRLYGSPDEFRRFVDRAHGLGIAVILDVVYNHLGPAGNFLGEFSPRYFTDLADPADPGTFEPCKLDLSERERHAGAYALHRDLLRRRREDAVLTARRPGGVDGAVLGPDAFVIRFFDPAREDRLLVVNLGRELSLEPAPEPLLAPVRRSGWQVLWSSEDPRYGGAGTPALDTAEGWRLPAHSAVVLGPVEKRRDER